MTQARVAEILDAYLRALEAGDAPDREALLAEHADVARELALALDSLDFIRRAATSLSGDDALEGKALGDYRLVREIGRGGMAVVYEAEQVSLGRRVALKVLPLAAVLDPKQLQRFKNEALAAAHLQHPHIVPVHGVGSERGVHYYAMQYIEGQSLAAAIRSMKGGGTGEGAGSPDGRGTPISSHGSNMDPAYIRMAAALGVQAAEALDHAHQLGIVHRDVKPGNLLVDDAGTLFVTDFGLASSVADVSLTMTGEILGTIRYMSPEQARAKRATVDHRTDVYSLGATLYELFTLEAAFPGDDAHVVIQDIATKEPAPPRKLNPALPRDLETVILKALSKDPSGRYATAQEMADDLGRCLADRPILARRPSRAARAARWSRRHRGLVAGALSVLFVGVSALAVGANREERNTREALKRAEANLEVARSAVDRFLYQTGITQLEDAPLPPPARVALLEEALKFYEARPDDPASTHHRTYILHALHRYEGALAICDHFLAQAPTAQQALLLRGHMLWHLNRFDEAVAALDRAAEVGPPSASGLCDRGRCLQVLKRTMEALAAFDGAIRVDPKHAEAYFGRAMVLLELGRNEEAVESLDRMIEIDPSSARANDNRGVALLALGRTEDALAAFDRAIGLDPRNPIAFSNRSGALSDLGRHVEALASAERAVALDPSNAQNHFNHGHCLLTLGRNDEALAAYDRALAIDPRVKEAHTERAIILVEKGLAAEALASVNRALAIDPDFATALVNRGGMLSSVARHEEALASLDRAIQIEPKSASAHYNRGRALMALNRDDEARAALARSIAIDPGQAAAHRHLSHLLDAIGDHEEAIRHQREVTRITPDDAREHYNLGCKLMARGHLDDAIREFDETLRLRPDDAEAHCNRGQVLLHQERPREALESFQRGHELGSKRADWAHPSKEWVESARWRVEFADRMERMLSGEEQPRDAAERVRLATLLSRRARHTEAARMWTEAFAEDNALAEDLSRNHRYNAACAAALAAEAGGADAAAWRGQTLEWLRADLAARAKDVAGLVKRLQHWKSDPDLAGVRDRIDGLPEPERGGWRSFWAQVDEALAAARTAAGSAAR